MGNAAPEFEVTDELGKTAQYAGTVGTSSIQVPPSPIKSFDEVMIRCGVDNVITKRLLWSIDNVTFHSMAPGEWLSWNFKKNSADAEITQIYVKGNVASVAYEILTNYKEA